MMKTVKKYRQLWLILPIVVSLGVIVYGGIIYINNLRLNLTEQAIANVLTVTEQQQQAFDNFIAADRERLHGIADFLSHSDYIDPEDVQRQLTIFYEANTVYSVVYLDEGWFCSNTTGILALTEEQVDVYRALEGSGVRDTFVGIFSGIPRFSFYETFTLPNGSKCLLQKSYDRSKVSETFSLSFYNNRGLAYVVNERGDILLRSVSMLGNHFYENIFEILTGAHSEQADIDRFGEALSSREPGSITFDRETESYIYSYVPIETVDNWYLVSIVPESAITEEADEILLSSRQTLMLLIALLVVILIFGVAVWYTSRAIRRRESEIGYQAALIDIFSTYLARNTDNVFMLLDAGTVTVDYASPNVERVLGVTMEQMVADVNVFHPTHKTEELVDLSTFLRLEPGSEAEGIPLEWVNPQTQEPRWLLESVYCTQVQNRKKLVFYVSDRTKERRTQDSLTEALQMAKAASEAKSAFLGNVSHDIRTPMNAIIGFTTLLKDATDNPATVREYAGRIETASQHLLSLINDVLDINKIESGSTTLNLVEMDLAEVVDGVNSIIRPQARAKNQIFEITVSPLSHELLQGDKLRINQILINLLSNSVKYTPVGGRIEMRVDELPQRVKKHSHVRFTVSDNGMGMTEEYLKVIFDPFTREETQATYGIQGTGLGMTITKSLVDLMGGSIKVESKLGEGSTFTVDLELLIQEQEDDPAFWSNCGLHRMLVVDDEEAICQSIVSIMAQTGVEVDYATGGEAAFEMLCAAKAKEQPYTLVLLDWKMPQLNGLETARLIQERYPEKIPVLMLTAYDWRDIEQEATQLGIRHFMPKPFFMNTFKNAIKHIMGGTDENEKEEENDDVVRGKRILAVDDIDINREILLTILDTLGAVCDSACNGKEAVELFEKSQPGEYDLILMDVQMPVMNGYEATRAIRASAHPSAKSVPIVAMTANAFVEDVQNAIESGMDAHISKPIQVDNMKSTIQQVFNRRAVQSEE